MKSVNENAKKLKELSEKYKGCRCSQYCSVWNSEDRDCEIMGENHLSPSRCGWFLMQELAKEDPRVDKARGLREKKNAV